ncbi:MAG: hypothetical protein Q9219_003546 [cf. Caloplaca sp. 3 TL-2023]
MPLFTHPIHDLPYIRSLIPTYLFRVASLSSQGKVTTNSLNSHFPKPAQISASAYRDMISAHLSGKGGDSFFISSTSSLLRALVFARWKCLQGEQRTRIAVIKSWTVPDGRIFPATYLVEKYGVPSTGKPWHDRPDGEFLVEEQIDKAAILGMMEYKSVAGAVEALLPELADKPHQLTEELRPFLFGSSRAECLLRATTEERQLSDRNVEKDYEAAKSFSQAFKLGTEDSLILTLMGMSLRERDHQILGRMDFFKGCGMMQYPS